jgi:8-amino-7-oxononanoate synthase
MRGSDALRGARAWPSLTAGGGVVKASSRKKLLRKHGVNSRSRESSALDALHAEISRELEGIRDSALYRRLRTVKGRAGPRMIVDGREVLMLAGSNYLDLSGDPRVVEAAVDAARAYGCAAGGSRLINGNLDLHDALEADLAELSGAEAALVFSTGYMANLGVITALAGPQDAIVSDELNHASIIDACRLSGAAIRVFRHNDPEALERAARALAGFRRRLLVVDGVFSMDGDVAPLRDLVPIARAHEMAVILDDVHGFGVLGATGRGVSELEGVEVDVRIGNLGKALGSFGAFVACSRTLRELLVNRSRSFIFTCGLPPGCAGAARAALRILEEEPWRREAVLRRAEELRAGLRRVGYDTGPSTTHIVPAAVGDNDAVMRICEAALERGVYAQGIRYPSVPEGSARIRLTPMCSHTSRDIELAVEVFGEIARSSR